MKKTAHLPITTGMGEINLELGRIARNEGDSGRNGQRTTRLLLVASIVGSSDFFSHALSVLSHTNQSDLNFYFHFNCRDHAVVEHGSHGASSIKVLHSTVCDSC